MSAGTQDGLLRQVTNERAAVAKQETKKGHCGHTLEAQFLNSTAKQKGATTPNRHNTDTKKVDGDIQDDHRRMRSECYQR